MNSLRLVSQVARLAVKRSAPVAAPIAARSFVSMSRTPMTFVAPRIAVRAFADEPFLDPKVVTERIIEVIKNFEKVDPAKVTPTAKFAEDLNIDSLDAVEVVMAIEEEFAIEIPDSEADKILSIPDAVAYISGHPMAK